MGVRRVLGGIGLILGMKRAKIEEKKRFEKND